MKLEAPNTASHRGSLPGHLASIPSTWRIARLRHAFNFNKGLTITKENLQDEGIPCVSYGEVHSKYGFEVDPDRHQLKCVDASYLKGNQASLLKRGDFIFADTSEDIEGSGNFTCYSSDRRAFAGYHTLIAKPKVPMNSRFMAYVFDSAAFRIQVQVEVKGVKVFSIGQGILKPTFVWLPPRPQQDAVAAFLDEKCAKVDEAVRIKEEQIALLRERRQILIQEAVTRGLNPDAPMKESGIDWIGQIPAHWDVTSIRYAFKFRNNQRIPISASDREGKRGKYPYYGASGIIDYVEDYIFEEDLILIAEDGANLLSKSTPLAFVATGKYWVNNHAHILEPLFPGFGYWAELLSAIDYTVHVSGAAQPKLTKDRLGGVRVPIPPSEERMEIISFIKRESEKFANVIAIKEQQITALKEYKTTLINAAVTGKIKVA